MSEEEMNERDTLLKKHRKEKKELQAKIISIKKSFDKGDKKKKKEAQEEIDKLEKNLVAKHEEELKCLSNPKDLSFISSFTEKLELDNSQVLNTNNHVQPISKAQRRRDKKELNEKQRLKEIEAQEEANKFNTRNVETIKIGEKLRNRNLVLHDIPSDGDCLFAAICHHQNIVDVKKLRRDCVDIIRSKKTEYIPFLANSDTGEVFTDSEFEDYCSKMANTNAWGGQMELHAISDLLGKKIEVIQAEGPPTIFGENLSTKHPSIILTYHRHYLALGEHYNSTIPLIVDTTIKL